MAESMPRQLMCLDEQLPSLPQARMYRWNSNWRINRPLLI